jgi:hypothetical protein
VNAAINAAKKHTNYKWLKKRKYAAGGSALLETQGYLVWY